MIVIGLFLIVLVAGVVYAFFEFRITLGYLRFRSLLKSARAGVQRTVPLPHVPHVTVQLPLYNERVSAVQLIRAVAAFDYPRDRFTIQVLDDSDDETTAMVAAVLEELESQGYDCQHVRRGTRAGWKAGALAHGLTLSNSEFVAIFDADFEPDPDFLRRILIDLTIFDAPDVAFFQARWSHINPDRNLLTQVQALYLDRHFFVQKPLVVYEHGTTFFNGSAGVWRRAAIDDAGGWSATTLSEDMDVSFRAALRGWRGAYDLRIAARSEIPEHMLAFKQQQRRWSMGSAQCTRELGLQVLRSPRLEHRADDIFVLAGYVFHPLLLAMALLWPWLVLAEPPAALFTAIQVMVALSQSVAVLGFTVTLLASGQRLTLAGLRSIALTIVLGMGLCVNNTVGFLTGLFKAPSSFERTPKHYGESNVDHYRMDLHWTFYLEIALLVYFAFSIILLIVHGHYVFLAPYLLWVGAMVFMLVGQLAPQSAPATT